MDKQSGRSLTVYVDDDVYKVLVDYKVRTGTALKYLVREALADKAAKIKKEK